MESGPFFRRPVAEKNCRSELGELPVLYEWQPAEADTIEMEESVQGEAAPWDVVDCEFGGSESRDGNSLFVEYVGIDRNLLGITTTKTLPIEAVALHVSRSRIVWLRNLLIGSRLLGEHGAEPLDQLPCSKAGKNLCHRMISRNPTQGIGFQVRNFVADD